MTIFKPQIQAISGPRYTEASRKTIRTAADMDSSDIVTAKCLNLPGKCDSAVAEYRFVSLKPTTGTSSTSRAALPWRGLDVCQTSSQGI